MYTTLTSLKDPKWANEEQTSINCVITTSQLGTEELPFTASPSDPEAHGRQIFADLVAGKYGLIADYTE